MSEVVGTTAALHVSRAPVKFIHSIDSKKGVHHVDLDSAPGIAEFIAPHALVEIDGPIVAHLLAPASADIVISAAASIVPTNVRSWPTTITQVRADVSASNFAVSALTPVPTATLTLHPAINQVIKPRPVTGRHPAILFGWLVQTTATSFVVDIEVTVNLKFSGADWVQPSSW